jgi:hypothetical protein
MHAAADRGAIELHCPRDGRARKARSERPRHPNLHHLVVELEVGLPRWDEKRGRERAIPTIEPDRDSLPAAACHGASLPRPVQSRAFLAVLSGVPAEPLATPVRLPTRI